MAPAASYAGDGHHTGSYYAASAHPSPKRSELSGQHDTDICIIGAGYTGISAGLQLAERGHKVTIIEGARVGWGASGRNGGQIVHGLNASLQTIERRFGRATARFVAGLVKEGAEIIRSRVKTYGIKCDLKEGNVFTALTAAHMRGLEERRLLWVSHGHKTQELLDAGQLRQHVVSDLYVGGLIDHSGGHFHPLNLAQGEAEAFEKSSGVIFEQSPVIAVDHQANRPVIRTAKGQVTCRTLLLCGNAYLGHVVPELTNRVLAFSTQVMATKPLGDSLAKSILPSDTCVEDVRYVLDYYRLSADKRLLFGGGTVYGGSDPRDIEAKLRRNLKKVFPQLADVQVDYAWSGNCALSFTRVPQMGRLGPNTYFAHGYSGHGVTGSHLFGRILAEAVNGDLSRFDVFAKLPWHHFPGGRTFRVQYSMLGSWWYGLRDKLGV